MSYHLLIELQVLNGDKFLEKHLSEGPSNTRFTSRFCARVLIEAIDILIERNLICSLQKSPHVSILADECQDISTQKELFICGRWLVNGKPEEHFLTALHVRSTNAGTIAEALQSLQQKQLDLRKLFGQGYDGAATLAGEISGVYKEIQTSSAHAIYIQCSCHRLQLASIQAAASVKEIRMFWNHDQHLEVVLLFPKKAEALKGTQAVLGFPELKIVKPSDTRWLSPERCVKGICNELPPLCKPIHSYTSHLEMLSHMVYTPF